MVLSNEQAVALISAAQEAASVGQEVPVELRCQYPSKRCDHVRTIKRGGGLHRLCSFHRSRANKNQWLVDQRRRQRREREGSLLRRRRSDSSTSSTSCDSFTELLRKSSDHTAIDMAFDVLDATAVCAPFCDQDIQILQALLFNEDEGEEDDGEDECIKQEQDAEEGDAEELLLSSDGSDICPSDSSIMEWVL